MKLSLLLLVLAPVTALGYFAYKHLQLRKRFAGIPSPRSRESSLQVCRLGLGLLSTARIYFSVPFIGHVHVLRPDMEGFIDQVMGVAQLFPDPPRMVCAARSLAPTSDAQLTPCGHDFRSPSGR